MANIIRCQIIRVALFTILGIIPAFLAIGTVDAHEADAAKSESAPKEKVEPIPGLAELIKEASILKSRLRALESGLSKAYDLSDFEGKLTALQKDTGGLEADLEKIRSSESYSYDHLLELKKSIRLKMVSVDKMLEPITDAIRKIEAWQKEWILASQRWEKWQNAYQSQMSLSTVDTTFQKSQEIFLKAKSIILEQLEPLLSAEDRLEEVRSQAGMLLAGIDSMILKMRGGAAQSATPSMLSVQYYSQFDMRLLHDLIAN
ncbi:MAG: hypothetical protein JRF72_20330, partial [Deltaproteobacteria bacterium]|nr:hypothetical protein [Deltaproteobacteria bacterium]